MIARLKTRLDAARKDDGFTLIELLIVIVILGVLAGIVVFAVGGITDRGDKAACKSDFKSVEVAQEARKAQSNTYSTDVAGLVPAFLRSVPASAKYSIATGSTGAVTVTVTGVTGGLATCDTIA